jgi:hypothetical protein
MLAKAFDRTSRESSTPFRIPSVAWAMLAATLVNVVIFDLLVIRADNAGLGKVVTAGVIGIAAGVATRYAFHRYTTR